MQIIESIIDGKTKIFPEIGDRIKVFGKMVAVHEADISYPCGRCLFDKKLNQPCLTVACRAYERPDKKWVVFEV